MKGVSERDQLKQLIKVTVISTQNDVIRPIIKKIHSACKCFSTNCRLFFVLVKSIAKNISLDNIRAIKSLGLLELKRRNILYMSIFIQYKIISHCLPASLNKKKFFLKLSGIVMFIFSFPREVNFCKKYDNKK